jgi:hypothetical protein
VSRKKKKGRRPAPAADILLIEILPPISAETLRDQHRRLSSRLSFPLAALVETSGLWRSQKIPLLVLGLRPAEEADVRHGLLVEVAQGDQTRILPLHEIEIAPNDPAAADVQEYLHWFETSPRLGETEEDYLERMKAAESGPPRLLRPLLHAAAYCAGMGAAAGAIVKTVAAAATAVTVGAWIAGSFGILVGLWYGRYAAPHRPLLLRLALSALVGAIAGALLGALAGCLIAAYLGSILGCIAGTLLGGWLRNKGAGGPLVWSLAGAFVGGTIEAVCIDKSAALEGAGLGLLLGLGGGVLGLLVLVAAAGLLYLSED